MTIRTLIELMKQNKPIIYANRKMWILQVSYACDSEPWILVSPLSDCWELARFVLIDEISV